MHTQYYLQSHGEPASVFSVLKHFRCCMRFTNYGKFRHKEGVIGTQKQNQQGEPGNETPEEDDDQGGTNLE